MRYNKVLRALLFLCLFGMFFFYSCTHDPFEIDNPDPNPIDTMVMDTIVRFSNDIRPLINEFCVSCHTGSYPSGNVLLSSYDDIKAVALSGQLYGVIAWQPGFPQMPLGGQQFDQEYIDNLKTWIDEGAQNN